MARTRRHGYGSSAARLLGLLAVLLGLLAMHGLASTHHHAAAGVVAPVADVHPAGVAPPHRHGHAEHGPASSTSDRVDVAYGTGAGHGDGAAVTGRPDPACDGHCAPDVAALCLAVLTCASAVALLAAAARRRAGPHLPAPARAARVPVLRDLSLVTPDPVKDLCVSRT